MARRLLLPLAAILAFAALASSGPRRPRLAPGEFDLSALREGMIRMPIDASKIKAQADAARRAAIEAAERRARGR